MKFAAILAAAVSFVAGMAFHEYLRPNRFIAPLGDEVIIETSDGQNTYHFRGHMITEPSDDWASDPRTAELARPGSLTRATNVAGRDPRTAELATGGGQEGAGR